VVLARKAPVTQRRGESAKKRCKQTCAILKRYLIGVGVMLKRVLCWRVNWRGHLIRERI